MRSTLLVAAGFLLGTIATLGVRSLADKQEPSSQITGSAATKDSRAAESEKPADEKDREAWIAGVRGQTQTLEAELARERTANETLRQEVAAYRARVVPSAYAAPSIDHANDEGGAGVALSAEQLKQEVEKLRTNFEKALAERNGGEALKTLKELAKLGKDAYPTFAELWLKIREDFEGDGQLGLSYPQYYMSMGDDQFLLWALQSGEAPEAVARSAIGSIPWSLTDEASSLFAKQLLQEKNPVLQAAMAQELSSLKSPEATKALLTLLQDPLADKKVRMEAAYALGSYSSPEAQNTLSYIAASDADSQVQKAAQSALVMQNPPASGVFLLQVVPESQATELGLEQGDILLSYNGVPLTGMDQLGTEIGKTSPEQTVQITIWQNGSVQTITAKGSRLGVYGKFVKSK